jgi:hypothetical protein
MAAPESKATSPEESEMHSSAARREVNVTSVWKKPDKQKSSAKIISTCGVWIEIFSGLRYAHSLGGTQHRRNYSRLLNLTLAPTVRNRYADAHLL